MRACLSDTVFWVSILSDVVLLKRGDLDFQRNLPDILCSVVVHHKPLWCILSVFAPLVSCENNQLAIAGF